MSPLPSGHYATRVANAAHAVRRFAGSHVRVASVRRAVENSAPIIVDGGLVGLDELAEDASQPVEFRSREGLDEVAADAVLVRRPDLIEARPALRRQADVEAPPVAAVELAADEPVFHHPVEHA